jgi:DNA-binding IclR family transcriptional regulator
MMARRDAPQGTQAILRAIRLLKVLSEADAELTLYQLSSATGLTKTTAHRLLAALESEGFITRGVDSGTYQLGPAVIALGTRALRTSDLRVAVRQDLIHVAETTTETATLEVLSDDRMLILDEVSGRHLVSATAEIGTQWPVHATSTGKALLAAMPEEQARALLKSSLRRKAEREPTDFAELVRQLDKVRRDGYATAIEELEPGFVAIGAALRGPLGEPVGAISVGGPTSRIERKRHAELGALVRTAAAKISKQLGHDNAASHKKDPSFSKTSQ